MNEKNLPTYLGDFLRNLRKSKKLRLEDLADENLSPFTISLFERNEQQSMDTAKKIVNKLGYSWEDILQQLTEEIEQEDSFTLTGNELYFRILETQTLVELNDQPEGIERINDLNMRNDSLYAIARPYFKGIYLLKKDKVDQAIQCFHDSIIQSHAQPEWSYLNIESMSYRHLALIAHQKRKTEEALHNIAQGLTTYVDQGIRTYPKYRLLIDQINYLHHIGQTDTAFANAEKLWTERKEIPVTRLLLELINLYGQLLHQKNCGDGAIAIIGDGIYLARQSRDPDMSMTLWTTLGELSYQNNEWDLAKDCFETALKLSAKTSQKHLISKAHRHLGELYLEEREWSMADEHLTRSLEQCHSADDTLSIWQLLIKKHVYQGDYEQALQFCKHAMLIAKDSSYPKEKEAIRLLEAQCSAQLYYAT
ncbi:helix-turn-helix domain-containing protein [Marininema halotolerans]|uniref:HTH cro/C1-type domain-containing protein n=1 Tax=Marininema halotolerans TaxID=1155944 RepID=A0A1I6UB65_9BACL|nr:hypothetical protein [Marininema halotolerans]SFS98759.1 hypothetical protein SAMN05444972_11522 [Marininema halotolerans]